MSLAATGQARDTLDPRDFGARWDGQADDTDAIQACVDAACGGPIPAGLLAPTPTGTPLSRWASADVLLPPGTANVGGTVRVWGVAGLAFRGRGAMLTRLRPVGVTSDLFDLNGVCWCEFSDFAVCGTGSDPAVIPNVIAYRWDSTTSARSSSGNLFRNINLLQTNYRVGLRVGRRGDTPAAPQIDCTRYEGLVFDGGPYGPVPLADAKRYAEDPDAYAGSWLCGFHVGDGVYGNILEHRFRDCYASNVLFSHYADRSLVYVGGYGVSGAVIPFVVRTIMPYRVTDAYTEDGGTLAYFPNDTSQPVNAEFVNVFVNTATSLAEAFSSPLTGGTVALSNVFFGCPAGGTPAVNWTPGWPSTLHVDRVTSASDPAALLSGLGPNVSVGRFDYAHKDGDATRSYSAAPRLRMTAAGTVPAWATRVDLDPTAAPFAASLPAPASVPVGHTVSFRNVAANGNPADVAGPPSPYTLAASLSASFECDDAGWLPVTGGNHG